LRRGHYAVALEMLDQLLVREPNNPEFVLSKGIVQMELWQFRAAIVTLTQSLSLDPSNPDARIRRASCCLRAGQLDAARVDYQELLKRFPNKFEDWQKSPRANRTLMPPSNSTSAAFRKASRNRTNTSSYPTVLSD
jgi:predicted Zn-dependent protease